MRQQRPNTEKRTVAIRKPNRELRSREYLTSDEIDRLMKAARGNRYGHRDATMILVACPTSICGFSRAAGLYGDARIESNTLTNAVPFVILVVNRRGVKWQIGLQD